MKSDLDDVQLFVQLIRLLPAEPLFHAAYKRLHE